MMDVTSETTTSAHPLKGGGQVKPQVKPQVEPQDLNPSNTETETPPDTAIESPNASSDDVVEFPGPIALTLITIALALAVFLTALVGLQQSAAGQSRLLIRHRIT